MVGGVSTYAVLSPSPPHPPSSPIISTSLSPVVTPWVKVWRERWEDYTLPAGGQPGLLGIVDEGDDFEGILLVDLVPAPSAGNSFSQHEWRGCLYLVDEAIVERKVAVDVVQDPGVDLSRVLPHEVHLGFTADLCRRNLHDSSPKEGSLYLIWRRRASELNLTNLTLPFWLSSVTRGRLALVDHAVPCAVEEIMLVKIRVVRVIDGHRCR